MLIFPMRHISSNKLYYLTLSFILCNKDRPLIKFFIDSINYYADKYILSWRYFHVIAFYILETSLIEIDDF